MFKKYFSPPIVPNLFECITQSKIHLFSEMRHLLTKIANYLLVNP